MPTRETTSSQIPQQRWRLLAQIASAAEWPMMILSAIWLLLLVMDLVTGLSPALEMLNYAIWAVFGAHFLLEFAIAPSKAVYLRRNWITALALAIPAFRLLRVLRAFRILTLARATRSISLIRVLVSLNRGIKIVRRAVARSGIAHVVALTALTVFIGAAGMLAFEGVAAAGQARGPGNPGFSGYGHALWWTAMIVATMGTDYWPVTAEGRLLSSILAIYGFSVFGFITARIASYFIGAEARRRSDEAATADSNALRNEIAALRRDISGLMALQLERGRGDA